MATIALDCDKCKGTGIIWLPRMKADGSLVYGPGHRLQRWPQDCPRCDGTGRFTPKPVWRRKRGK